MKYFFSVFYFFSFFSAVFASDQSVVRLTGHGGSAVCVYADAQRTVFVTADHVFGYSGRRPRWLLDIPAQSGGRARQATFRILARSHAYDVAFFELGAGYACRPCVVRVLSGGNRPQCYSSGFDRMRHRVKYSATLKARQWHGNQHQQRFVAWITRETNVGGRSGGGLFESSTGDLVGLSHGHYGKRGSGGAAIFVCASHVVEIARKYRVPLNVRPHSTQSPPRFYGRVNSPYLDPKSRIFFNRGAGC